MSVPIITGIAAVGLDNTVGSKTYVWIDDKTRKYNASLPAAINGGMMSAISSTITQLAFFGDVRLAEVTAAAVGTGAVHFAAGGSVYHTIEAAYPSIAGSLGSIYTGVGAALGTGIYEFLL